MMTYKQEGVIHVSYCNGRQTTKVGRLAIKSHKTYFEYSSEFLESGIELSPFKLPLKPGVLVCEDPVFDGLFGVFNDSLPDGWGRLLLDRKLLHMGINPSSITALDRLQYVGCHGMGALQYKPEIDKQANIKELADLDTIADECLTIQESDADTFVDDLLILNGSSAGARPKILVSFVPKRKKPQRTENSINTVHNDWIIKFRSTLDPKDIGAIEYAYHLMAKSALLHVPEARIFKSNKCSGYFGVKRFDRQESQFLHVHTVSGLLHADHRIPCLDYETIMKTTFWLTKDIRECEKQFRNVVFNVLAHNRDDHAKNFSYLMGANGLLLGAYIS